MKPSFRPIAAGLALAAVCAAGDAVATNGWVLNTNQTIHLVNLAGNAELPASSTFFPSDSLAATPAGVLIAADPAGVLWNVTGAPFPVGPTGRTQVGDLDWDAGGLWGFSNASQELFFYDLGTNAVTYSLLVAMPLALPPTAIVTGVAAQPGSGDVFLSARDGLNNDFLLRVPASSSGALLIGSMVHGDAFSYIADIDFDAGGTLVAMTWFHRDFYAVNPLNAATTLISNGPYRDSTALALLPVPEPAAGWLWAAGLAALAARRALSRSGKTPRRP
jgi:hypothetical protein